MRNLLERWQYYISGVFLTLISLVILFLWDVSFFNLLLGIVIFGVGAGLCFSGYRQGKKQSETSLLEGKYTPDAKGRAIYTEGGNYTESIQGDCITIQGNQIYINRDLSQLTGQIQEVLSQLQTLGYTHDVAEQRVANELKTYAHSNARVRETLLHWRRSLESSRDQPFNITEAVERVANIASENLSSSIDDPILLIKGQYKKLFDLLREGLWEEADEETTKIILDLMPDQNYCYLESIKFLPKI